MKNASIQKYYEKVYVEYNSDNQTDFLQYERNHILANLYKDGEKKRILDLGAGSGVVSKFFLDKGYDAYGIEWNENGVDKLFKKGINALQRDIEELPYPYEDNFFDEVFWGDNVEHLFFPELVAKEIYRILKPGGRLVVSTPNHGWIVNRLYYLFMGVPRRTEGRKTDIWEWQHIRYFNKKELFRFLRHCGFQGKFSFHAAERRFPFSFLSSYLPSFMGSVMVVEAHK
ncbi:methyltransferase domain-containing protein [Leptolyngbya cf. ectocarpi LEGE 11479]|uniref:Methyltransferase domain-containing protein n=1 Tax=Leptolyngbya cf. ectocarpi LEGE 11479 TaxID=1828722 RepID=A0A928ZUT6_LEPEC|nr:class I SAM-dependent methyltransferase [Leptolyngbya ectocarpi]MBE9067872.1 methyltransferase domain-containing protein [Leptolyngbya cf. ectocarpi LEGE 11479]